jgi:hypothetical protein
MHIDEEGDIIVSEETVEVETPSRNRLKMLSDVAVPRKDRTFMQSYFDEEFFSKLRWEAMDWLYTEIEQINLRLKELGWEQFHIVDPLPQTLIELYEVVVEWFWTMQMHNMFGFGAPPFPADLLDLWQAIQIIQMIYSWDQDQNEYVRQMCLRTDASFIEPISVIDSGKYSKSGWTRESYARATLMLAWRWYGPCRLLTFEQQYDDWGRPHGAPRPYEYSCRNGKTVKEQWLA